MDMIWSTAVMDMIWRLPIIRHVRWLDTPRRAALCDMAAAGNIVQYTATRTGRALLYAILRGSAEKRPRINQGFFHRPKYGMGIGGGEDAPGPLAKSSRPRFELPASRVCS